ncbi:hypothetical protein AB4Y45_32635 [Paraburkholderia sp. EG287A]|uniref:hypothetical protein n=1 Tax=Paraburkholderia sp. EG287A TaxID=3237012 RepID=UPI0034D3406C
MQQTLAANVRLEFVSTAALAAVLVVLTWCATWLVSRHESMETRRFWRLTFRHLATLAFVVGFFVIWRHQLHNGVVALGAALAGLLVTLRENWLSLVAFWVRIGRRHYGLDDFIEIDGVRGRVLNISWLTTDVAEVGPRRDGLSYTGRVVYIPNYRTLLAPVVVENVTGQYSAHIVSVTMPTGTNVQKAEALLMEVARRACEPFMADAALHMQELELDQAMDTPSVEPKVLIHFDTYGLVILSVRIVAPSTHKQKLEQSILRDFFARAGEANWPGQSGRPALRKARSPQ